MTLRARTDIPSCPAAPTPAAPATGFGLRTFAPSWGAPVMGTSALAVALAAVGEGTDLADATTLAARVVLLAALLVGVVVLGATGGPLDQVPGRSARGPAATGAVLALLIRCEFLAEVFTSSDAAPAQMSGAWFVAPVVTIITPLALLPLVVAYPTLAGDLLAIGGAFLGMGAVLYSW